jgi:hypothetical protein
VKDGTMRRRQNTSVEREKRYTIFFMITMSYLLSRKLRKYAINFCMWVSWAGFGCCYLTHSLSK